MGRACNHTLSQPPLTVEHRSALSFNTALRARRQSVKKAQDANTNAGLRHRAMALVREDTTRSTWLGVSTGCPPHTHMHIHMHTHILIHTCTHAHAHTRTHTRQHAGTHGAAWKPCKCETEVQGVSRALTTWDPLHAVTRNLPKAWMQSCTTPGPDTAAPSQSMEVHMENTARPDS